MKELTKKKSIVRAIGLIVGLITIICLLKFYNNNYIYDEIGFNKLAIHKETKSKYDENGYDKNGYDINKYDKNGYNLYGIHKSYKYYIKTEKDEKGNIIIRSNRETSLSSGKLDKIISIFNERVDELNKLEPVFGWVNVYNDEILNVIGAGSAIKKIVKENDGILLDFYLTKDKDKNYWLNINFDFLECTVSELHKFKISGHDLSGKETLSKFDIEMSLRDVIIPIFSEEISTNYFDWIKNFTGILYYHKYTSRIKVDDYLLKILEQKDIIVSIDNPVYYHGNDGFNQERTLTEQEIVKLKELLFIALKKEY